MKVSMIHVEGIMKEKERQRKKKSIYKVKIEDKKRKELKNY